MQPAEAAKRAPRRGSRTSGSLKTWEVIAIANLTELDWLLRCPSCDGCVAVNSFEWLAAQPDYQTRSCTFCSKAARIPDDRPHQRTDEDNAS